MVHLQIPTEKMKIFYNYRLHTAQVAFQVDDEILTYKGAYAFLKNFGIDEETAELHDPYDTMCRIYAAKCLEINEDYNTWGMGQAFKALGPMWRSLDGSYGIELLHFSPLEVNPESFTLERPPRTNHVNRIIHHHKIAS